MYENLSFHCFGCNTSLNLRQLVQRLYFPGDDGISLAGTFIRAGGLSTIPAETERIVREPQPPSDLTYRVLTRFAHLAVAELAKHPEIITQLQRTRGIDDPVNLGIGWAASWMPGQIATTLKQQGISPDAIDDALIQAGLCVRSLDESDRRPVSEHFRLFRHALILTDWYSGNGSRNAVFYQARATVETRVKYLCPPNFPKPLFGWDSLKQDGPYVWLCEGPFDILPLIEAGQAAVAVTGSTIKSGLVQNLVDATAGREILIAFDRDDAGMAAAPKVLMSLQYSGANARIVHPPAPYKDMGEWATAERVSGILAEITW